MSNYSQSNSDNLSTPPPPTPTGFQLNLGPPVPPSYSTCSRKELLGIGGTFVYRPDKLSNTINTAAASKEY